ncbi:toll/interleukin-1 receptor domain-containing protein [Streptomyces sp. SID13031]|uniref:toll/interleukin-1 receptor domain-containing protein n=1 Tax=Streptomyces sp. SID13031 TaxID=2706046 RepID=UPI0013C753DE|nr:toll/interleukin-1 receptor domain-containing protein [Streptomyces sp. SID13031]NEA32806.1 toll/interleukin-1 receptor domain-containing protein [Streptomyces sp. SID13031]
MNNATSASIFINYRSSDEHVAAVLLDNTLSARFGEQNVFLDSKSMAPGTPFDEALRTAVRDCDVLLVVIGSRWLTSADEHGRRLIDHRGDWVRLEIVEAERAGKHVVPVLVGDVPPLAKVALPAAIRSLAGKQFLRLRPRDGRADLDQIVARTRTLAPRLDGFLSPA